MDGRRGRGRPRGRGRGRRGSWAARDLSVEESTAESSAPQATVPIEPEVSAELSLPPVPPVQPDPVHHDPIHLVKLVTAIKKLGAVAFPGGPDYLPAINWLEDMKVHFSILSCSDIDKRLVAAYLLSGEARDWWKSIERAKLDILMDWTKFQEVFLKKFFPSATRRLLQRDFLELKQGDMTVREYETKFSAMYRFAKKVDDQELAEHFVHGLNHHIRRVVAPLDLGTLAEALHRTIITEQENLDYKKETGTLRDDKGKGKAPAESSGATEQGNWKKKKTNFRQPAKAATPVRATPVKPLAQVRCYNCNELGHVSTNCPKPRGNTCFTCGQPGHMARTCTQPRRVQNVAQGNQNRQPAQRQAQGQQPAGGQPRVYALGQENPVVEGTLTIFNTHARVLFDTGASHSCISKSMVEMLELFAL